MADDITSDVNTDESLVEELKKEQHKATIEKSVASNTLLEQQQQVGLMPELVEMSKRGVHSTLMHGVERCIRVIDAGAPNQRHCLSMMVSNLSTNEKMCTRCTKQRNPGVPQPKVINSSMIRLSDKELKECGLDHDPTYVPPEKRGTIEHIGGPIVEKATPKVKRQYTRRISKVAVPKGVRIEVSLEELEKNPNIVNVLLQKALEAIYELPITKFSEAEAIRGTSEKIKELLDTQGE